MTTQQAQPLAATSEHRTESLASIALTEMFAEHRDLNADDVAIELDRRRRIWPLSRIIEVWDLSHSDIAAVFAVSRQAVAKWVASGVPADRSPAIADLAAATDILVRHLKRERIPAVVRRTAPGLGGRSLLQIAVTGDTPFVVAACRDMFAFEDATA